MRWGGIHRSTRCWRADSTADAFVVRKPAAFLAKRFAAKEAVVKALGTGFRSGGGRLTEIGVLHDAWGAPQIALTGMTEICAKQKGVYEIQLSLSDEREYALAFVVLIGNKKT
jgi:holo-[acyl-carrier protein] synthase